MTSPLTNKTRVVLRVAMKMENGSKIQSRGRKCKKLGLLFSVSITWCDCVGMLHRSWIKRFFHMNLLESLCIYPTDRPSSPVARGVENWFHCFFITVSKIDGLENHVAKLDAWADGEGEKGRSVQPPLQKQFKQPKFYLSWLEQAK